MPSDFLKKSVPGSLGCIHMCTFLVRDIFAEHEAGGIGTIPRPCRFVGCGCSAEL